MGKKKTQAMKKEAAAKTPAEPKIIKLDIGCGQNKKEGFTGIDKIKLPGVDVVWDLEKFPYPFDNDSVDEIHCSHYVEHTSDLNAFMDEIFRIMKPGSKALIIAPYYSSIRAWQDPTHKRAISEITFMYYNKDFRDKNKLDHYGIKSDFDFVFGYAVSQPWASKSEEARTFAIRHYINVVDDIHMTLTKRIPGTPLQG